jgi:hypothetical protein
MALLYHKCDIVAYHKLPAFVTFSSVSNVIA